jgi:hypothetical protein
MLTTRLADHHCPNCHTPLSAVTHPTTDATPSDGDYSVCLYCGHLLVIEGGHVRNPTDIEMREMAGNPDVVAAVEMAHQFRQWRAQGKV